MSQDLDRASETVLSQMRPTNPAIFARLFWRPRVAYAARAVLARFDEAEDAFRAAGAKTMKRQQSKRELRT
jgi:hypothetical protein